MLLLILEHHFFFWPSAGVGGSCRPAEQDAAWEHACAFTFPHALFYLYCVQGALALRHVLLHCDPNKPASPPGEDRLVPVESDGQEYDPAMGRGSVRKAPAAAAEEPPKSLLPTNESGFALALR